MALFASRRSRRGAYATANDQFEPEAIESNRRIQWTVPLRASRKLRKLPDEEQGPTDASNASHVFGGKPTRPKIAPRYHAHHERQTLDIAQTRSYPENEKQETVILTRLNPEAHDAGNAPRSEIHWVHLKAESNSMSFEDFQRVAADVPGLEDDEVALIVKMLKSIQSSHEKPFVHGEYGKYLIPTAVRYDGEDPDFPRELEQKYAIFFALPYFDLRPLRKLKRVDRNASLYLMRTLLQSHHRLASTEDRDRKQAILKLTSSQFEKKDEVLYLPELWCLIISQRIVLTYAAEPLEGAKSLFGKTISTEAPLKGPTIVRYETLGGDKHYFPITQCKTWQHLRQTIKLHEEIFDFDLETRDGEIITEDTWKKKVSQEYSLYIDVYVRELDSTTDSSYSSGDDTASLSGAQYELVKPDEDTTPSSPASSDSSHEVIEISPTSLPERDDGLARLFKENQTRLQALMKDSYGASFSAEQLIANTDGAGNSSTIDLSSGPHRPFGPPRRAETIGLAPSQAQRRDFESYSTFDQNRLRPLRRTETGESSLSEAPTHSSPQNAHPFAISRTYRDPFPSHASPFPKGRGPLPNRHHPPEGTDLRKRREASFNAQRRASGDHKLHTTIDSRDRSQDFVRVPSKTMRNRPSIGAFRLSHSSSVPDLSHQFTLGKPLREVRRRKNPFHGVSPQDHDDNQQTSLLAVDSNRQSSATVHNPTNPIFLWPTTQPSVRANGSLDMDTMMHESATTSTLNNSLPNPVRPRQQSRNSKGISILSGRLEQQINDTALDNILQDAQKQLEGSENGQDAIYYARVVEKPFSFVESLLSKTQPGEVNKNQTTTSSSKLRDSYAQKKEILRVAQKLLGSFAPVRYPSRVVEKYWGAVSLLLVDSPHQWETKYKIQSDTEEAEISTLSFILGETLDLLAMVEYIITGISPNNDAQRRLEYRIPPALMQAFTHIIMFYVYHGLARVTPDQAESEHLYIEGDKCTDRCRDLLTLGLRQLIVILHTRDDGARVSYEALKPETIVSVVMENFLDKTLTVNDNEMNIAEIYSEYISQLDLEVHQYPGAKVFGQIRLLGEELEIIERTLAKQYQLVMDYAQITEESNLHYDDDDLSQRQESSTYSDKLRKRVLSRTADSLNEKLEDIRELKDRAAFMQWSASQAISIRAESNDKAILTFTVVTVIFLPLSFVTGYLGMNVEDIRDTGRQQSIFWVVALPVTAIIGFVIVFLVIGPTNVKWKRRKVADKVE